MPTTNYGKVVIDTSMVPYIRSNEVEFVAHNLKPYKLSKLFFDDVAVNQFCQGACRMLLDSKKAITLSRNNATTIDASHVVYQGSSNTVNTFNGIVDSFTSANSTIVIRRLLGSFDKDSQLFIENVSTGVTYANCNVISIVNIDTADSFYAGESVVCPERNNGYATVIATSGENVLYLNKNYISLNVTAVGGNTLTGTIGGYKSGDVIFQTLELSPESDYWINETLKPEIISVPERVIEHHHVVREIIKEPAPPVTIQNIYQTTNVITQIIEVPGTAPPPQITTERVIVQEPEPPPVIVSVPTDLDFPRRQIGRAHV